MYKVLKGFKGSPDGFTVIEYKEGQETDLVPALAEVAIKEKWVKKIKVKTQAELDAEAEAAAMQGLFGSSILPAVLKAPNGKEAVLGDIVLAAFETSGLTAVAWNALLEDEREPLIAAQAEKFIADNQAE